MFVILRYCIKMEGTVETKRVAISEEEKLLVEEAYGKSISNKRLKQYQKSQGRRLALFE